MATTEVGSQRAADHHHPEEAPYIVQIPDDDTDSTQKIWYFAYGSNLSTEKFTGGRGITPLAKARVRLPEWRLAFNVPGLPYAEPTFAGIVHCASGSTGGSTAPATSTQYPINEKSSLSDGRNSDPPVTGVAYLITRSQFTQVFASEGGGIVYKDLAATAEAVGSIDEAILSGPRVEVRTLGVVATVQRKAPWPRASRRYMEIVRTGAAEAGLPPAYQRHLASFPPYIPPQTAFARCGAEIFLATWNPVMGGAEKLTHATMREDGYAPEWVIWLVRLVLSLIWLSHDFVFAPIFGRGDGLAEWIEDDGAEEEKRPMLWRPRNTRRLHNYRIVWYGV